ncbi:MAG: glycosyltransferase family 2 protein [Alphaproteobacteria bacterium]|nr:glycosyltransferase family 2 protein [Alphaproteobacteria bacterium]
MREAITSLSVVVPVFNEADSIEPLMAELHEAMEGLGMEYEMVFVDDGSTDSTPQRLSQAKERHPRLRSLRHGACCGQSAALRSGIAAATHPWIVTLDGDGQNDPADIPRLIATVTPAINGIPPLVTGVRRKRQDSLFKRLCSRIANTVRRALLRDGTPDTGCSLKLFSREIFLSLPYFDHMHRFLPALFKGQGSAVILVDVNHRPRQTGISKYGLGNRLGTGIIDLAGVWWLLKRGSRPVVESEEHDND